MFDQIRRRWRSAALIGTAAALVGGGMALAADDNGSGSQARRLERLGAGAARAATATAARQEPHLRRDPRAAKR